MRCDITDAQSVQNCLQKINPDVVIHLAALSPVRDSFETPMAYVRANISPPAVAREFRGAWITTLNNITWPSRPGLPVAEQKRELEQFLFERVYRHPTVLATRVGVQQCLREMFENWSMSIGCGYGPPAVTTRFHKSSSLLEASGLSRILSRASRMRSSSSVSLSRVRRSGRIVCSIGLIIVAQANLKFRTRDSDIYL